MKSIKITIIGAGQIGTAVGSLFAKNQVRFWDKNPLRMKKQLSLESLIPDSDLIFLCLPSWAIREVLEKIKPLLNKKAFVVSLAKGLEGKHGKNMDVLLAEYLPRNRFGLLCGPMIAEEIMKKFPTIGVMATRNRQCFQLVSHALAANFFHLYYTSDVRGAANAGTLKNIYAISLGMADCLELGHNVKGWMITQIINEMTLITKTLGGKVETVLGLCGLGDLIATGFSTDSLHFQVGHDLIKFGKCSLESEGLIAIGSFWQKIKPRYFNLPILKTLYQIIKQKSDPKITFLKLIENISGK